MLVIRNYYDKKNDDTRGKQQNKLRDKKRIKSVANRS